MQSKIVELDLNEIDAVAGGATYATLSSSATLQSSYTATTYVRPAYTSTSFAAPTFSTASAPSLKLI